MSWRFIACTALFITCLLTANVTASKLITAGSLTLTAGIVLFPVAYIVGDVLTEVWGYAATRRVIWLGFGCNLLMVAAIEAGRVLPPAAVWPGQAAYEEILGQTPRILGASFAAYLIGEFANAYVLARLKIITAGRWLWVRTIGSTVVGEGLDSLVFVGLAFTGHVDARALVEIFINQWLVKVVYEALATPLTYVAVGWLKSSERIDTFDLNTDFNPLKLT